MDNPYSLEKLMILSSLIYSASAFVVTKTHSMNTKLSMKLDLVGASAPLGFFDPLGFSKTDDATLFKYRESELKHGRVAMLAVLGWLTQEHFHPLYDGKLSGNPLKALGEVPPLAWVQIVAFTGFLEYFFTLTSKEKGSTPGDYYGMTGEFRAKDDPSWIDFQTRELNNGRLAMFAILGEITHAALTGKGALEQIGL